MLSESDSLVRFFGGAFHQDCFDDDPTWEDVVQRYKESVSPDEHAALAHRIELELLTSSTTESELVQRLSKLGSYYRPEADGFTNRKWLIALVEYLKT